MNSPKELYHHSQTNNELPIIPQSSFQPEPNNHNRHSVVLDDIQVPQEAQNKLYLLFQNKSDSTVSKSSADVGRTNLFEMDIWITGSCTTCKPYPIPLMYQKFIDDDIQLKESAGCISKA